MFLPFGKGSIIHVYNAMKDTNLSTPLISISAIDFGKKFFKINPVNNLGKVLN